MAQKQSLKQLQKTWYKRLKDEGFVDIEQDEDRLKVWSSDKFSSARSRAYSQQAKANYYYIAYQLLNSHAFEREIHKVIWEYHTNGISIRKIVKLLESTNQKEYATIHHVSKIIYKYRKFIR